MGGGGRYKRNYNKEQDPENPPKNIKTNKANSEHLLSCNKGLPRGPVNLQNQVESLSKTHPKGKKTRGLEK